MRKLQAAGFETWCVGGAVRDALLGIRNQDWDIATAAEPQVVRRMFSPVVPLGIEFGTVGVVDRNNVMHEVTTFRREVTHDGRHAVVEFGASFVEDLNRRDFTINAIAFDPIEQRLYDPFHGRDDLELRRVRAVGVPIERFVEDRLRVLRGIRFAARFNFEIEHVTWQAMVESGPHLGRLSYERVKQELDKTLEQAEFPSGAFQRWKDCGAFKTLLPVLADVSDGVLRAVDILPRPNSAMRDPRKLFRRYLRVSALFSELAPRDTVSAMKTLRASKVETAFVASIIERLRALETEMHAVVAAGAPTDAILRVWAARIGRVRVREFMRVVWARWKSGVLVAESTTLSSDVDLRAVYRRLLHIARNDAIEIADLAIDGDDLRSAGIPFGPHIGQILSHLIALVVNTPELNTREQLIQRAAEFYAGLEDQRKRPPGNNASE